MMTELSAWANLPFNFTITIPFICTISGCRGSSVIYALHSGVCGDQSGVKNRPEHRTWCSSGGHKNNLKECWRCSRTAEWVKKQLLPNSQLIMWWCCGFTVWFGFIKIYYILSGCVVECTYKYIYSTTFLYERYLPFIWVCYFIVLPHYIQCKKHILYFQPLYIYFKALLTSYFSVHPKEWLKSNLRYIYSSKIQHTHSCSISRTCTSSFKAVNVADNTLFTNCYWSRFWIGALLSFSVIVVHYF